MRCSSPSPVARPYHDRTDWWEHVQSVPAPRVVVIEDLDSQRGLGSFIGEVHAGILRALECVGVVTNGSVRDLPATRVAGFHLFAGGVAVSHAYAHIVDFGQPVRVGGLPVRPGDLLLGDVHGVLSVPGSVAEKIPAAAARQLARERRVIELCRSSRFSVERLCALIRESA
jgi:regulator of RNase E activity RraA